MNDAQRRTSIISLMVAAVQLISQPLLPPATLQPATLMSIYSNMTSQPDTRRILALLEVSNSEQDKPRPEIGGHRITEAWLLSLGDRDCRWRFRMSAADLMELADALRIPILKTRSRSVFPPVEALGLLCARFRTAGDMFELSSKYNRSQSAISECINELVEFLDDTWEHLLGCDSEHLLHPSELARYADAIRSRGSPLRNVFAFIDCTIRRICRPSQHQRQAYNGHKKFHALKFQALMLPNGIIGHLYGPFEGRRNDVALLNESRLLERLAQFAFPEHVPDDAPEDEQTFYVFGDPAYGLGPHIVSPFSGPGVRSNEEREWNAEMSAVRIEVEHGFGIVSHTWPFLNAGWKMQLYSSPVGRFYRVGVLLTNCLNCMNPNQVATYFDCAPPYLDDYLHD